MRNALAYVPKGQNTVVAAAIRQSSSSPIMPPRHRSGGRLPTSCAPAGRSWAPAWMKPSMTCWPT
ncbi:hypothetical protein [Sphingomonas paucimobilis]|uniref:hypothetical protein n=1 Tax=Sphingomonas paucimobilis TaxID=13689 RepID=UPI0022B293B3|nr:hypothetical protein [Sphingomonas paucimobilis]